MMPFCCVAISGISGDVPPTFYRDGRCQFIGGRGKHAHKSQPSQLVSSAKRHTPAWSSARPVGTAREPDARCATTNAFVIRNSAEFIRRDKHLAAPSNGFLTAAGFTARSRSARTTPEMQ